MNIYMYIHPPRLWSEDKGLVEYKSLIAPDIKQSKVHCNFADVPSRLQRCLLPKALITFV